MRDIAVRRCLSENTRVQDVVIDGKTYALHKVLDEILLTDLYDYSKIFQITSIDFWNSLQEERCYV